MKELEQLAAECQMVEKKFLDPDTTATAEKNREVLRFLLQGLAQVARHIESREAPDYP
jgi:hypothetical protein